jgi:hypothetical protein
MVEVSAAGIVLADPVLSFVLIDERAISTHLVASLSISINRETTKLFATELFISIDRGINKPLSR